MRRLIFSECIVLVYCLALVPAASYGQSQSPTAAPQPSTSATDSQTTQGQTSPATQRMPAKVWTNDEIGVLRNDHSVSVVGSRTDTKKVSATSKPYSQEKDPAWYRKQLISLQAEIEKLDARIAKTQAFLNGENVGEPASLHRQLAPSPQDQLKQMEAKRQADAVKMDDLLDRARHNGIEPGELR
jgi:hypothetical protein